MPLENTTNFAWVSIDSLLLASSSGEKRDWDENEGTNGENSGEGRVVHKFYFFGTEFLSDQNFTIEKIII